MYARPKERDFQNQQRNGQNATTQRSAVGEQKRLKVQFIPNNPNGQPNNFNLQINPKSWPNLKVGDILEIRSSNQSSSAAQCANQHSSLNRSSSNFYSNQNPNLQNPNEKSEFNFLWLLLINWVCIQKKLFQKLNELIRSYLKNISHQMYKKFCLLVPRSINLEMTIL